jgi:PAS domain S-box-containing protein
LQKTNRQPFTVNASDLASLNRADVIRVLHVAEDPSILENSKLVLQALGNFEIDNAPCVDEAFKKLKVGNYDVVISDYEMPQRNGLQFLEELREDKNDIPFILFTGKGREEVAIKALNLGADGYHINEGSPETVYSELSYSIRRVVKGNKLKPSLKAIEEKFKVYVENSPTPMFVANSEGKYEYVNEAASRMLGYSRQELLEMSIPQLLFQENITDALKKFAEVKETGKSLSETVLKRKDDQPVHVILNSVKLSDGKLLAFCEDITKLNLEKEALEESEAKLRSTIDASPDGITLMDMAGKVVDCNSAVLDLFGYVNREEVIGKVGFGSQTVDATVQAKMFEDFKELQSKGKLTNVQWHLISKDKRQFVAEVSARIIKDAVERPKYIVTIIKDITERKLAEEKLSFQAYLLNHVGQAIIMVDKNRKIQFWNKGAEKLHGWTEEEVMNRDFVEVMEKDSSAEDAEEVSRRLMTGETWSTELLVKRKDGLFVPAIINRAPLLDKNGNYLGAATIATDISDQKLTERDLTISLKELSYNLEKIQTLNEKLGVVGSLTRHDVRNKLSAITGYSYILKKKHADDPDVVEGLDKMVEAVKASIKIFDFAKAYEQLGVEELVDLDIEKVVGEAAGMFSGLPFKIVNDCHGLTVRADSLLR